MVHHLSLQPSLLNHFLAEIRAVSIQEDRMRFRRNMERIGEIMALKISEHLAYQSIEIQTPLGISDTDLISDDVVLGTIMRAGLPFHQGFLNYFDQAENAFVSAYRKHHQDGTFEIKMEYVSCPNLEGKVLILCDPMLATGASMDITLQGLIHIGKPKAIHIATVIASTDGVELIKRKYPTANIWAAAIDEELTAKSYIVPGLGDAGDLAYGEKKQH